MNNVLTKEEPDSLLGITSLYRLLPPPQLEQVKPPLQLPDTTRFLDEIGELEDAFNRGRLRPHLKWASRRVTGVYRKLLSTPEARNPLRATAFRACKSIFERDIRPPTAIFDAESLRTAVAFGELTPLAWRSQEIQVQVHQAALLRCWGIGYRFKQEELNRSLERTILNGAMGRLLQNIDSLRAITHGEGRFLASRLMENTDDGSDFEQAMMLIINASEPVARRATVYEDLLEKTDVRVKYLWLRRMNGARVQVTKVVYPDWLKQKVAKIPDPDEIVLLSPLTLAQYVTNNMSLLDADFWDSLGARPACEEELAICIRNIVEQNLTFNHPLGLLGAVPSPVHKLIDQFMRHGALQTTKCLRTREAASGCRPRLHQVPPDAAAKAAAA